MPPHCPPRNDDIDKPALITPLKYRISVPRLVRVGRTRGKLIVRCMTVISLTALVACANTQTSPLPTTLPSSEVHNAEYEPVILNVGNLIERPAGAALKFDADSEPLFQILVAEFAGQRGRLDIAAQSYTKAAKQLKDLEVAKRATRIAVFARDYPAALLVADIWVTQAPKDFEARQILAAMYIREGNAEAAIKHLEAVLDSEVGSSNRQFGTIANLLNREEDKLTALTVMEQLIARRGGDADALTAYALLAIRAEEIDRARTAMDKMLGAGVDNINITIAFVAMLQKNEKLSSAFAWLEKVIAARPKDTASRLAYARLLADTNRYAEARVQFAIVAATTPDNSDVVYALGLLNLQANRIEDARRNFTQLLKLEGRRDDANFYLGQIAESRDQLTSALDSYREVSAGPNRVQAQIRVALILSSQNRVEAAREQLKSIELHNDEQKLQIVRAEGEILTQHDQLEDAMAVYDQALVDTYDMELLYSRAMLAEKMDRFEILEADLKTIIEREPENSQALNALGYTLADHTDRYAEAHEFVKRALLLNPDDFYILDSMGWVLYRLGRLSEAVEYLTRARKIRDDPEVAAHLGEVLWVMGDKQAARDIWNSALQGTPDDQRLLDVIERLAP
ncbi:MAG: tetratricopeptide (TPR) repeat protein [Gammaproteobacteria bacterium]|jgi:tetratricopeptide (TPR) repeat protein